MPLFRNRSADHRIGLPQQMAEKVRVHADVKPYSGRLLEVLGRHTYPNGRKVVTVLPPQSSRGRGGWMHFRSLEYDETEVTSGDSGGSRS